MSIIGKILTADSILPFVGMSIFLILVGTAIWIVVDIKFNPPSAIETRAANAAKYCVSCVKAKDPKREEHFGGGTKYDRYTLTNMLITGNVTYETIDQWIEELGCEPFGR